MSVQFRKIDFKNYDEINFIAKNDVQIPAQFESDYSNDDQAIPKMLKALEKFTDEDFCEVAVNNKNEIIGYHIIKKTPYLNRFAGGIITLWVSVENRKKGVATELKKRGEDWAKANKLDHIYTLVHTKNKKMQNLNQKIGYEITHLKLIKKI